MIKIRGWRVPRGRGRAMWLGVLGVMGVCLWYTLIPPAGPHDTPLGHHDTPLGHHDTPSPHAHTPAHGRVSRAPALQVAPPGSQGKTDNSPSPPHGQPLHPARPPGVRPAHLPDLRPDHPPEAPQERSRAVGYAQSGDTMATAGIKPRYKMAPMGEAEDNLDVPGKPIIPQPPPGVEEGEGLHGGDARENYEEEEEGKWGGRNKLEDVETAGAREGEPVGGMAEENVALEEEDEEGDEEEEQEEEDVERILGRNTQVEKKIGEKNSVSKDVENSEKLWRGNANLDGKRQLENEEIVKQENSKPVSKGNTNTENKETPQNIDKDDLFDWKEVEEELKARRARVKKVCKTYNLGPDAPKGSTPLLKHPPTPNYDVFYIDRRDQLAWCPIYKAASTTWMYNFVVLGGLSEAYVAHTHHQVSEVARKLWPPIEYTQAQMSLKMCLKLMIVRHPFERLVSAFRDKLENVNIGAEHGTGHFYQKYGRKIVAKYRPKDQQDRQPDPRYSQDMDDPSIPPPKGIEPTFREFVKYLIDTDLVYYSDDHWMPYYLHCTPCLVDYDVIAKFETLDRDQRYVIRSRKLQGRLESSWRHLTKGKKTSNVMAKYFATITRDELAKLYDKYRVDFELFGYTMNEYLDYVRGS